MATTTNFEKHVSKNPAQQMLINNFYRKFLAFVKPLGAESILDVGCGEGFTLNKLQEEGIGKKLEGIEYLDTAIELGKKQYPKLVIKKGSIFELPYKDNSFDLVLCMEVLEHVEDPGKALEELARVSKKHVLLTVPNEPYFMMQRFLRGKNLRKLGNHPEHINHWTMNGFEAFVSNHGLKIHKAAHPFAWTMVLAQKKG